ncbi:uncharacterized protein Polr2M [Halyomorpha halys]|uniref:uncharacterized protein Polr2M n=1 Tax=Halyomorpha halys TaxID=286706 RepID=UPI0006D50218|nr:uncharacterized protein LOC106678480 [Halyomorpha halys]
MFGRIQELFMKKMPSRCSAMSINVNDEPGCSKQVPNPKTENEHHTDVKALSKPQLLELLARQNRLIKSLPLAKLPDKGEKVLRFKREIELEIERRDKTEDISDVLTRLTIKEKKIDVLEWDEKNTDFIAEKDLDGEPIEDEQNPLAILATHSGTTHNQKKVLVEKEDEPLITLADIEEVYAINLSNKIDKVEPKKRFLPHKSLISDLTEVKKKVRDLSAATPPLPVFGDAKLISLEESLKLQYEQTKHLKEVQLKHATERLKAMRYTIGDALPSVQSISTYRENVDEYSETEEESENENEEA